MLPITLSPNPHRGARIIDTHPLWSELDHIRGTLPAICQIINDETNLISQINRTLGTVQVDLDDEQFGSRTIKKSALIRNDDKGYWMISPSCKHAPFADPKHQAVLEQWGFCQEAETGIWIREMMEVNVLVQDDWVYPHPNGVPYIVDGYTNLAGNYYQITLPVQLNTTTGDTLFNYSVDDEAFEAFFCGPSDNRIAIYEMIERITALVDDGLIEWNEYNFSPNTDSGSMVLTKSGSNTMTVEYIKMLGFDVERLGKRDLWYIIPRDPESQTLLTMLQTECENYFEISDEQCWQYIGHNSDFADQFVRELQFDDDGGERPEFRLASRSNFSDWLAAQEDRRNDACSHLFTAHPPDFLTQTPTTTALLSNEMFALYQTVKTRMIEKKKRKAGWSKTRWELVCESMSGGYTTLLFLDGTMIANYDWYIKNHGSAVVEDRASVALQYSYLDYEPNIRFARKILIIEPVLPMSNKARIELGFQDAMDGKDPINFSEGYTGCITSHGGCPAYLSGYHSGALAKADRLLTGGDND